VLSENNLERINRSVEYWAKMSREPHREIQGKWDKCERHWVKINRVMKDVRLPILLPSWFIPTYNLILVPPKRKYKKRKSKMKETPPQENVKPID
jgi:hypothetical protein